MPFIIRIVRGGCGHGCVDGLIWNPPVGYITCGGCQGTGTASADTSGETSS
ncbi:hypothetical protein ACFY05_32380 [Microtetraspora fusca]|uniref:Uncharacterized protein n=1 Tax=Microtetraspora fusca TaxID=1997 RepID=A0ABW6VEA1_MICFU